MKKMICRLGKGDLFLLFCVHMNKNYGEERGAGMYNTALYCK